MASKVQTKYAVKNAETGMYYVRGYSKISESEKPELCGRLATARSNRRYVLSKLPNAKTQIETFEIVETSLGVVAEDETAIHRLAEIAKAFADSDCGNIFLQTIEEALHEAAKTGKWFRYVGVFWINELPVAEVKKYSTGRLLKMSNRDTSLRCIVFNNISDFVVIKFQSAKAMMFLYDFEESKYLIGHGGGFGGS